MLTQRGAFIGGPEQAAALLPKGALQIIPGAAHTIVYSAAEEFATAVLSFLELR